MDAFRSTTPSATSHPRPPGVRRQRSFLARQPCLQVSMREGSIKIVELVRGELAFLAGLELYPLVYYIRIGIVVMVHDNCVNLHFLSRNTYGHNKEGMLISLVD